MSNPARAVIIVSLACLVMMSACTTVVPYRVEGPGGDSGAMALLQFVNPAFISIVPYKIDGTPSLRLQEGTSPMEGTFLSFTTLNTEIEFAAGRHSIEFYSVNTDPVGHFIVTFSVEAGKTYLMQGTSQNLTLTTGGVAVPYTVKPVEVLREPGDKEPHATLTFIPGKSGFDSVPYLLRIDDKVRGTMYRLHPRWTTMNYSGLARGIVTSINMAGMIVQPNLEAKEGYLSIRIEPGHHRIEYFADGVFMGQRHFGQFVRVIEFDAVAGADYEIEIVPDAQKSPQGFVENGIRIVKK
jgi:hypothetical protein